MDYTPDFVPPPGWTLSETLEALNMTQVDLALRTGRPEKTINEIIKGKSAISAETAIQFERALGIDAQLWLGLEHRYQEYLARLKENKTLEAQLEWLAGVPVNEMRKLKWIDIASKDKVKILTAILEFFGVASVEDFRNVFRKAQVSFRHSPAFDSKGISLAAWLRKGEIDAQGIKCEAYNHEKFRSALSEIRKLTVEDPSSFVPRMQYLCAECGVAFVPTPELPGVRLNGAARWLTANKALIQINLRGKSNDKFWFSFFHEACHILNHPKRTIYIDDKVMRSDDDYEQQANKFASDVLIPQDSFEDLKLHALTHPFSEEFVIGFAKSAGIAPGIVVGRLQHEGMLKMSHLNGLKLFYRWTESS